MSRAPHNEELRQITPLTNRAFVGLGTEKHPILPHISEKSQNHLLSPTSGKEAFL